MFIQSHSSGLRFTFGVCRLGEVRFVPRDCIPIESRKLCQSSMHLEKTVRDSTLKSAQNTGGEPQSTEVDTIGVPISRHSSTARHPPAVVKVM